MIFCVIILAFLCIFCKNVNLNLNINVKQEFSEADRQLLEDLYNNDGDLKQPDDQPNIDDIIKSVNDLMVGSEEN